MKRVLRVALVFGGVLVLLVAGFFAKVAIVGIPSYEPGNIDLHVEVTPQRVARGKRFAQVLCTGCHLDAQTGKLTGKHMVDAPPEFGPIYSRNITQDATFGIGAWTDGELAYLLRTGIARDGSYLPPYMVKLAHLSDEDIVSIIAFLRSEDPLVQASPVDPPGQTQPSFFTKFLSHVAFKPLPYPSKPIATPSVEDKVTYGRYLTYGLDCFGCHSADFTKMNVEQPELSVGYMGGGNKVLNEQGEVIPSANLTPHNETGIGTWSEAVFVRTLKTGLRPDGKPLRYPMLPLAELTEQELGAIYAYLRTVPAIDNAVERNWPQNPVTAQGGKGTYYKYGCNSCHSDSGLGLYDLRKATQNFPSDELLLAWIKNAPAVKPGTMMPKWEGIIPEDELPGLVTYVQELCATAK